MAPFGNAARDEQLGWNRGQGAFPSEALKSYPNITKLHPTGAAGHKVDFVLNEEPVAQTMERSSISGFLSTSATSAIVILLTFFSGVLIARLLGPDARGEYGVVMTLAPMVATLTLLSFHDGALITMRRDSRSVIDSLPTMIAATTVLCGVGLATVLLLFALDALNSVQLSEFALISIFAGIVVTQAVGDLLSSLDRSQLDFRMLNAFRLSAPALFTLSLLVGWLWYGNALSLTLILTLFIATKLPALFFWGWRYRKMTSGNFSRSFAFDASIVALKLHFAAAAAVISGQIDRLFVIGTWSQKELGNYFVAQSAVGAGFSVVNSALYIMILPYLAGTEQNKRKERISQMLRLAMLFSLTALILGWFVIPFLIPLAYGHNYDSAVTMSLYILIASTPMPIRAIVMEAIRSRGVTRPSIEMSVASSLTIAGGWFITGYESADQVIWATGIANITSILFGGTYLIKQGDLSINRNLIPGQRDATLIFRHLWAAVRPSSQ